ncbi:MAG: hypothetical protein M3Y87_19240 [Myxococcota bacterium]|nr:hypothetical protein [Myxococcota bacterium]
MKLEVDQRFRDERQRYALRLYCEDCALFDEALGACAHGFPTAEHRRPEGPADDARVVFCKDFELA